MGLRSFINGGRKSDSEKRREAEFSLNEFGYNKFNPYNSCKVLTANLSGPSNAADSTLYRMSRECAAFSVMVFSTVLTSLTLQFDDESGTPIDFQNPVSYPLESVVKRGSGTQGGAVRPWLNFRCLVNQPIVMDFAEPIRFRSFVLRSSVAFAGGQECDVSFVYV